MANTVPITIPTSPIDRHIEAPVGRADPIVGTSGRALEQRGRQTLIEAQATVPPGDRMESNGCRELDWLL